MAKERKFPEKVKFYRKDSALELTPLGMIETAKILNAKERTYDWAKKLQAGFSEDEMLQIIDVIKRVDSIKITKEILPKFNEMCAKDFKAGGLKVEMPHLKAKIPKTIIVKPQIYNNQKQLNIAVLVSDEVGKSRGGLKSITHSLDWHQAYGFKLFLEESFKKTLFAAYDAMNTDNILSTFWFENKKIKEVYLKRILTTGIVVEKQYVIAKASYDIETDSMAYMLERKAEKKGDTK